MKRTILLTAMAMAGLLLQNSVIAQVGNYFAGFQSGTGNTGSANAFVGYQSGIDSNTGSYNAFFGYQSGILNGGGSFNTFIGSYAGYTNESGGANTFTGSSAGLDNTTGSRNSFYGNQSGFQVTTGSDNSFFGNVAGYSLKTGTYNAFFGNRAGFTNTASQNTFIGSQSGERNTSGTLNTFLGRLSGFANTTGGSNTFLGSNSGDANTTGGSNTFVGQNSGGANTTGNRNVFVGIGAGILNTSGYDNTFLGREAGRNNTTGTGNTAIGNYAQMSTAALTNAVAIGNKSIVRASNSMVLGSINGENGATVTMKVGIGTSAPGYNLHVNGTAAKPGGGAWLVASDKRLKKNIKPFTEGLDAIAQINPVWFQYNGKAGLPTDKTYVGVIAQDIQKVAPYTVSEFVYENEGQTEKYLDYDANALTYAMVNAIKELDKITKESNAIIRRQEDEIKKLKEEIALFKGKPMGSFSDGAARLWQNAPNPYSSSTIIRYYVPEDVSDAQIQVISITGQEVYSRQLTQKGDAQIEVSNQMLSTGSYVYQLIVDGKIVDKKKMVLGK